METVISNLVSRFERGTLSRRELVQGLGMILATSTPALAQSPAGAGLKATRLDHVSIQVKDLTRSVAFYQRLFGFRVTGEDKATQVVRLGTTGDMISLHQKSPTGVDHIAISVEDFHKDNKEEIIRRLIAGGFKPIDDLDAGFHVTDPDGINIQLMAT